MNRFKLALMAWCLAFGLALPAFAAVEKVNINTADAATLDRVLQGVGPAKAAAIVEHRRQHGPFRSVEQLVNVRGIGPATLEINRDRITVGPAPAAAPASRPAAQAAVPPAAAPRSVAPAPRAH
jgi:competence protein ComEA